jgi:hypothetical protein
MIERIEGTTAISLVAPSGRAVARRQRRLRWLLSLREALDEAGPLVEEMGTDGANAAAVADTRARITDALSTVEEMRGRLGASSEDPAPETGSGDTITATELASRIARAADRSVRMQARLGAVSVRRLVDGTR